MGAHLLAVFVLVVAAQGVGGLALDGEGRRFAASPPAQPAGDEAAIVGVLQRSADGWNAGDLDAFMAPYDEASTFMTAAGPIDRAATRARYVERYFSGGRPEQTLAFDELDVRILGSGVALMTGRFVLTGGGKPEATGRFTLVWRHGPAGWKIVHDHTS